MHADPPVIGCCGAILSRSRGRSRSRSRSGLGRLNVAVLGALLTIGQVAAQVPPPAMSPAELAMLDAVNGFRASKGRAAWLAEPGLAAVARAHSQSMAADGRFSHDGFRRRAESTGSAICVENLLQGPVQPAQAVQMWQRSNSHRDNLLEPAAQFAGVGMAGRFVTLLACATPFPSPSTAPAPAHPASALTPAAGRPQRP